MRRTTDIVYTSAPVHRGHLTSRRSPCSGRELCLERRDGRREEIGAALRYDELGRERRRPSLVVNLHALRLTCLTRVLANYSEPMQQR